MTPKEKAKALIDEFRETGISFWESRQCALIAVEVILKDVLTEPDGTIAQSAFTAYQYWQKVKQAL